MTSTPAPWGTVEIRRDGNLVIVEPEGYDAPRVHRASVRVVGATLQVDITATGAIPRALIDEPFLAQAWLEPVMGSAVADAVELFRDSAHTEPTRVVAERGELSPIVEKLGVGYWLHRWWPAGSGNVPDLDARLLEIEIGTVGWLGEALFVDTTPIEALLEPHVELLVEFTERVRNASGSRAEHDLGVLTAALRATSDLLDDDVPGYARVVRLLEQIDTENAVVAAEFGAIDGDWADADLMTAMIQSWREITQTDDLLMTSRTGDADFQTIERSGLTTADSIQIPPRTVLAQPGNVTWSVISDDAGTWLTVRVDAAPSLGVDDADSSPMLLVRAFLDDLTAPPIIFPIAFTAHARAFIGRHPLPSPPTAEPAIDIFDPAYALRPRLTDDGRQSAKAERDRIIEIIRARGESHPSPEFIAEREAWEDE